MLGIAVNPASIQKGDSIATRTQEILNDHGEVTAIKVLTTRKVGKVSFCDTQPESFHLDGECYDTRFSTVVRPLD